MVSLLLALDSNRISPLIGARGRVMEYWSWEMSTVSEDSVGAAMVVGEDGCS